jgi:hypothetical protein
MGPKKGDLARLCPWTELAAILLPLKPRVLKSFRDLTRIKRAFLLVWRLRNMLTKSDLVPGAEARTAALAKIGGGAS